MYRKTIIKKMEQKIQHIVKETVEHYIMDNILLGYSHNRGEFQRIVQGLSETLIIHWCLIRWGRLTGNTQTIPPLEKRSYYPM